MLIQYSSEKEDDMALKLENLDKRTRKFMLDELEYDLLGNSLYISPRLSERGQKDYVELLREAINTGDDSSFAANLGSLGRINLYEQRLTRSGSYTTAKVPFTAAETLAGGEFNRFYARGLCKRAIKDGVSELVIYRAKQVREPRPESQAMIGKNINAKALLDDLRTHPGVEPALGLPPGPNSGLSIKLP